MAKKMAIHTAAMSVESVESSAEVPVFLTNNARMVRIKEIAARVADTDVPVLILGESGVGKEVLARFIQGLSARQHEPFVKINCAAVPHELLESELFGHERGAFTGAIQQKPGKFELAGKGIILLDEIGDMNPYLQAKLLHVLEDHEYIRVGGRTSIRVHARILAATNKLLEEAVENHEFREDLYFRLNVMKMEIPPLRERKEDIPLLCEYFLQKYRRKYKTVITELPENLLAAFQRHSWPGNVRELKNAIKRYVILPDIEMAFSELREPAEQRNGYASRRQPVSLKEVGALAAERAEKEVVLQTLEKTNWNRKEAARRLDICYKALLNKLKKWDLDERSRART